MKATFTLTFDDDATKSLQKVVASGAANDLREAAANVVRVGAIVCRLVQEGYTEVRLQNPTKQCAKEWNHIEKYFLISKDR